ncbi:Imm7 family immunity protein [Saccharomonospora sp. NPDC046836]|uniref:Imm7 family immunity protein n=1 Tax=Saccharomonospora sp. NPDC046836 TaxID=3156921 RepID=UPI0033E91B7F
MYEFHGWFGLDLSTEEADFAMNAREVERVRELIDRTTWTPSVSIDLRYPNGQAFLTMTGFLNRKRDSSDPVDSLLELIASSLPGSWGLLYERDDEMPVSPGSNAFKVRVLARGRIENRLDPFLPPCNPVIED